VELRLTASALNPLSLLEGASTAAAIRSAIGALSLAGGTLTGKLTTAAPAAGGAGISLPHGVAPTTPVDGDVWTTTSGLFAHVNGATKTIAFTDSSITGNAGTATKLQTARTINGTSFDGSANITTANWGTARTLTIGNTGKSVNGSANVSWSLAEIGAARFSTLAVGTDLNTVVNPGFYRIAYSHGNAPADVNYGQLIVARGGGDTILQIVTGYNNGEIYWRQGNPPDVGNSNGSWGPWRRFFHSGNLALPIGVGQTWQNVTAQRALGTTYTNTTGRPIQILVQYEDNINSSVGATFKIGSLSRTTIDLLGGSGYPYWFSAVIPDGVTYSISGGVNIPAWWELR
jgi:hypothetical protein